MAQFRAVAKPGDIAKGEMTAFTVEGTQVAIANVDGAYYAFGDICTHAHCSLAEGDLEDLKVTCPCHGSQFDITTGAVQNPPADEPIPVYRVLIAEESIQVEV